MAKQSESDFNRKFSEFYTLELADLVATRHGKKDVPVTLDWLKTLSDRELALLIDRLVLLAKMPSK